MRSWFFLAGVLGLFYRAYSLKQAVATINARGITGTIKFTAVDKNTTRIEVNLSGLTGNQRWHIHELPIDQTIPSPDQCMSTWAGPHYDPFDASVNPNYDTECSQSTPTMCEAGDLARKFGPLPPDGKLNIMDTTGQIDLEGLYSIVGRSVVIHEEGSHDYFECGTIRSQDELNGAEVTILQSVLVSPVAGHIYFKQVSGLPDVQIWGKLYYVNDHATSINHDWHIHNDRPGETYRVGVCGPETAGPHYDPTMKVAGSDDYSDRCRPETPMGCEIGDLAGKLGTINVAAKPAPYNQDAFFFTDSFLNLTGFQAVIGRSIVVHVPDQGALRIACAPLVEAENLTVTALYPIGGSSLATFSQYSHYQDTAISLGTLPSLDISGSNNSDLTILAAVNTPNEACFQDGPDTSAFDSTFTPFSPTTGVSTPDAFALGDLSGAYIHEITSNNYFSVFDLSVFGARSTIAGHTLRYVYSEQRSCVPLKLSCSAIEDIVSLRALFASREIGGNILFFQERADHVETGSTLIIVDIYYINGSRQKTSTHNWYIYLNASIAGEMCADVIDGHYNPFMVSLGTGTDARSSDYSVDCTENYQLRCKSGDMTGKHGQLTIASFGDNNRPTYSFIDSNLELGGAYSIEGRSVGLHLPTSEGGALFDCATITAFTTSETTVTAYTHEEEFTNRVEFVMKLTANTRMSPNDIIIVGQNVTNGCVATIMKTMGVTQNAANNLASTLSTLVSNDFTVCGAEEKGSAAHLTLLSPLFLFLLPSLLPSLL